MTSTLVELSRAARQGDVAGVRAILKVRPALARAKTESGWGPLFSCAAEPARGQAAKAARLAKVMTLLLDAGGSPNDRLPPKRWSLPVLFFASGMSGNLAVTRVLLARGAKPNDGESLYHSVENRYWDCAEALRRGGGDLNFIHPWYGNTPLYFIARTMGPVRLKIRGRDILTWLFRHRANPNLRCGKEKSTALHAAAERGWPVDLVTLLLRHGANPRLRDGAGRTPAEAARHAKHPRLARLLSSRPTTR